MILRQQFLKISGLIDRPAKQFRLSHEKIVLGTELRFTNATLFPPHCKLLYCKIGRHTVWLTYFLYLLSLLDEGPKPDDSQRITSSSSSFLGFCLLLCLSWGKELSATDAAKRTILVAIVQDAFPLSFLSFPTFLEEHPHSAIDVRAA